MSHLDPDEKWTARELIDHIKADWPTYDAIELMDSYARERSDWIEAYIIDADAACAAFAKARDAFQAAQDALVADLEALVPGTDGEKP